MGILYKNKKYMYELPERWLLVALYKKMKKVTRNAYELKNGGNGVLNKKNLLVELEVRHGSSV